MLYIRHGTGCQRGSLLIDVLIGLIIVVPALLALMTLYTRSVKGSAFNKSYNNAVYVAQQTLEEIKQYDGTSTIKNLPSSITNPAASQTTFDGVVYTAQVSSLSVTETIDSHMVPYKVIVSWTDNTVNPAATRSIQVAAYYYSN